MEEERKYEVNGGWTLPELTGVVPDGGVVRELR